MLYPEIIYKYRDWDNPLHRSILLYNELYFASPKDFNDPFDCRITKNFELLNTEKRKNEYIDKMMIDTFPLWSNSNNNPYSMIERVENRLKDLPALQKEFESLTIKENDLHYGVICFSAVWNSILRWSHYAKSHQGYCVGFYEEKIRNYIVRAKNGGKGGMVIYDSKFPEIDPLSKDDLQEMFLTTHFKSLGWKYECEYRVSKLNSPEPLSNIDRLLNFPDEVFAEVILGVNINTMNKREIIELCRKKNIPAYQAVKVPQKFYISCEPI